MNNSSGAHSPFDDSQPTVDLSANASGANGASQRADANATQPLPVNRTSGSGRLGGSGSVLGALQSGTAAPVGSNVFDPPDNPTPVALPRAASTPSAPSTPSAAPTGRLQLLPMPTLIGLAVAGGALIVVLVPALMRGMIPTVPVKQFPAEVAVREPASSPEEMPPAPSNAETPLPQQPNSNDSSQVVIESESTNRDQPRSEAPRSNTSRSNTPTQTGTLDDADVSKSASSERGDSSSRDGVESRERVGETNRDTTESARASGQGESNKRSGSSVKKANKSGAWMHPRTGYTISPPSGFERRQTGRRTIWRGPGGAQILVETTTAPGTSARADWERLDAALAKKYGRNYRSLGIRETELAGRPAAVWEFAISSKRGTTRKIDVAVHAHGRGYAVLAEASAARFDEMRPQLEEAIASFQPPASTSERVESSSLSRSTSRNRDDDEPGREAHDDKALKERKESPQESAGFSAPGY